MNTGWRRQRIFCLANVENRYRRRFYGFDLRRFAKLDYNVWRKTAAYAYSHDPEAAFFINMGDLVDNGEQYSQWRSWFRGVSGLLPQILVAPTQWQP